MATTRIDKSGRLTIPAAFRKQLGIADRSRVSIEVVGDQICIRHVKSVCDVYGIFADAAKGKTNDWDTIRAETERLIAEQVVREGME